MSKRNLNTPPCAEVCGQGGGSEFSLPSENALQQDLIAAKCNDSVK